MFNRSNEIKERLEQFRKNDSAILNTIARRHERLNARQNALRATRRDNGGNLIEDKRRAS